MGLSLLRRGAILLGCLMLFEIPLGSIAFFVDRFGGVSATLAALFSSVVGGLLALAVSDLMSRLLRDEMVAFAQAVSGMLVRVAVGLAVCAVAYGFRISVSGYGLVYYVLVFYMLTLAVETGFVVRQYGGVRFIVSSRVGA